MTPKVKKPIKTCDQHYMRVVNVVYQPIDRELPSNALTEWSCHWAIPFGTPGLQTHLWGESETQSRSRKTIFKIVRFWKAYYVIRYWNLVQLEFKGNLMLNMYTHWVHIVYLRTYCTWKYWDTAAIEYQPRWNRCWLANHQTPAVNVISNDFQRYFDHLMHNKWRVLQFHARNF